ncbi:MAG: RNA polymerase sigma factor [Limisphaerales bacterium]
MKAVERHGLLKEETVVSWFYRVLRNSIIDMYRSQQTKTNALERFAAEFAGEPNAEVERDLCKCMNGLLAGLKPAYADVLRNVDLGGKKLTQYAKEKGRSENAMRFKLQRAREKMKSALKGTCKVCADHGCLDCDCK